MSADTSKPQLNESQEQCLETLRSRFVGKNGYGLDLDDACLLRYLRARQYDVEKACGMLQETLEWRKHVDVDGIMRNKMTIIREENSTGKVYLRGEDKNGRVILVMKPALENTSNHDGNILHLIYQMERARLTLQKRTGGYGKLCLMIDYSGYSMRNAPPLKTTYATLHIVQNHYPELLGVSYMLDPPFIFSSVWKLVYPLMDTVTRNKFIFIKGSVKNEKNRNVLSMNFELDKLEKSLGGNNEVMFDSELYLSAEMDTCYEEVLGTSVSVQG